MMFFIVALGMSVMCVLEKNGLVDQIARKRNSRNAQSWECALESIPSRERASISPSFSVENGQSTRQADRMWISYALAQGSLARSFASVDALTNCFISKPVGLDDGAMRSCSAGRSPGSIEKLAPGVDGCTGT